MPFKETRVRRWEVAVWFLGMGVATTLAIYGVEQNNSNTHRLVVQNRGVIRQILVNRQETLRRIHAADVRSCKARHKFYVVLVSAEEQAIRDGQKLVTSNTLPPTLQAAELKGLRLARRFIVQLRGADCTHVPDIVPRPSPSAVGGASK